MQSPQRNDFFTGAIIACSLDAIVWILILVSLWWEGFYERQHFRIYANG